MAQLRPTRGNTGIASLEPRGGAADGTPRGATKGTRPASGDGRRARAGAYTTGVQVHMMARPALPGSFVPRSLGRATGAAPESGRD